MNSKKLFVSLILILLLIPVLCLSAFAADEPEFIYELSVDGKDTVEVNTGDIIAVTLHLRRTDSDAEYTMYSMQDEIRYESGFFELVEDSAMLYEGINSTDIAVDDDFREFYMNFLSFSGGTQWEADTCVGKFQLRVVADSGVTTITNEDYAVSLPDGSGSYSCETQNLTVILSTECTVRFETNGGTKIEPITAIFGEKINCPEEPTREGKSFDGWCKDINLSEPWDFDNDTVQGNMTLYAKWVDAPVELVPEETPAPPVDTIEDNSEGAPVWIWILIVIIIIAIIVLCFFIYIRKKMSRGRH